MITIHDPESHEKLTAKVFYEPDNENGYRSFGDILDYDNDPDVSRETQMTPEKGFTRTNDEQVDTVHYRYQMTLSERDSDNERILNLATKGTQTSQSSASGSTATITGVEPGRSYFIGSEGVSNVTVQVSAVTKTEGTDYELDKGTGEIRVLEGAGISSGDDLDVTYDEEAVTWENYTVMGNAQFRGKFRIEEYNQFSAVPLRIITFKGVLNVVEWPEQSGPFGQFAVRVTATEEPDITKREQGS